tara:strand:+ start:1316 stop:1645 length:330 start_codon:yes stop_codon:yes gene_type:complete
MKIIKNTKSKTDILSMKDGSRIFLYLGKENEVDDKYKEEILESILYKTGGIKIVENRIDTIGSIKVDEIDEERVALIKKAISLGLKPHHKAKNETIKEMIAEKEAETNE